MNEDELERIGIDLRTSAINAKSHRGYRIVDLPQQSPQMEGFLSFDAVVHLQTRHFHTEASTLVVTTFTTMFSIH